jgi:hypothetical protein
VSERGCAAAMVSLASPRVYSKEDNVKNFLVCYAGLKREIMGLEEARRCHKCRYSVIIFVSRAPTLF